MPGRKRDHYRGDYPTRRAAIIAAAYANPNTRCPCGLTLAQHPPTHTGKPQRWDADHIRDGDPTSPLQPMAMSCNRSAGAAIGNRRRAGIINPQGW